MHEGRHYELVAPPERLLKGGVFLCMTGKGVRFFYLFFCAGSSDVHEGRSQLSAE